MTITWTEFENRALLPAYETQVGDICALVHHPRRQPTRWHVMIWDADTDPDQYTIICTDGGPGWDTADEAKKYAELWLTNQR
jgi:hypothetical protein